MNRKWWERRWRVGKLFERVREQDSIKQHEQPPTLKTEEDCPMNPTRIQRLSFHVGRPQ